MLFKHIKSVGILFLLSIILISCNSNDLQTAVDEANKKCPTEVPGMGEVKSFTLEGNDLTITYVVNEKVLKPEDAIVGKELVKENFKSLLHTKVIDKMMPLLQESGCGIKVRLQWNNTNEDITIEYTPQEVKNWKSYGYKVNSDAKMRAELKMQVAAANRQLPADIGDGITLEKIALENGKWVYYDHIQNKNVDMNQVRFHIDEGKQSTIKGWTETKEPGQKAFINLCLRTNTEIVYRYFTTDTTDIAEITITLSDLKKMIK